MLEKQKEITLTGQAMVDGQVAVRLTAKVSTDPAQNYVNQAVQDLALYNKNRTQVRKDMNEFQDYVFEHEDQVAAEIAEGETKATTSGTEETGKQ